MIYTKYILYEQRQNQKPLQSFSLRTETVYLNLRSI